MSKRKAPTYPGGMPAIIEQMERRRAPLAYENSEGLPPLDMDFAPYKIRIIYATAPDVKGSKSTYAGKYKELAREFDGESALLHLHGLLVAHLRRRDQPAHTAALFERLWREESEYLLDHLDNRWLVSAITTFAEHGQSEAQRHVGTGLSTLFAMMKLYETERLFAGLPPSQAFSWKKRSASQLAMQMDPYSIAGGGLDVNMLGRLWQDSEKDDVIRPLAQHLLTELIHDPLTVFRRLRIMRGKRAKDISKDPGTKVTLQRRTSAPLPVPPHPKGTPKWGTVSLVKGDLSTIAGFAAYHLDMGASRVYLYLDEGDDNICSALNRNPKIVAIPCHDDWWVTQKKPRMPTHQRRQVWCATQCYGQCDLDYLAHIDLDEFLITDAPLSDHLSNLPDEAAGMALLPAEMMANDGDDQFFKLPRSAKDVSKDAMSDLYPTFGHHLRDGLLSHTAGKLILRTGIDGVRFGIHAALRDGRPASNLPYAQDVRLGHAHAPTWDAFTNHLKFRREHGSYRKNDGSGFGLADVLDFLEAEEGIEGLRRFYTELNVARPDLIEKLGRYDLLIKTRLDLDAKRRKHFPDLSS